MKSAQTFVVALCLTVVAQLTGCAHGPVNTGLTGEARPTGTVTLLRVDDAWRGSRTDNRSYYDLGDGFGKDGPRFVPLRSKNDVAGLDGSDRVVTDEDFVVISLNSGFIRYFKELGGSSRSGEIALVVSFDAGAGAQENILIYSAKGQTLGSFFPLDDWPVIGPVKITGDYLRMRVVMIELDQQENAQARSYVKFLSQTAGTFSPGLAGLFSIGQPAVDKLISLNDDDVALDYRFALKRYKIGEPAQENPLLYGKYVVMLQEDRLAGNDAESIAPGSASPVVVGDMRFDRYTNRIQQAYSYTKGLGESGPVGWKSLAYDQNNALTSLESHEEPNADDAVDYREKQLGFEHGELSPYDLYSTDVSALERALVDACRGASLDISTGSPANGKQGEIAASPLYQMVKARCGHVKTDPEGNTYKFDFPVTQYPQGYTILAQYPFHTHLVFAVERSIGGTETPYHEGFQKFSDYMQQQLKEARSRTDFTEVSNAVQKAALEFRKQKSLVSLLHVMPDEQRMERACVLWKEGLGGPSPDTPAGFLSKAQIYNEIYHVTGRFFADPDEVAVFIENSGCTAEQEGENKCSCKAEVEARVTALASAPEPEAKPDLAEGATGESVKELQLALKAKGFDYADDPEGTFGSKTEAAVEAFQHANGLAVDGVVGKDTRKALGL